MRKRLSTLLKITVTVGGMAFVLSNIDLERMWATLLGTDPGWLLFTFLLVNASLVIRAFRWSILLRGLGVDVGFPRLVSLYFVGNFFNAFLPTSFGGDVMRIVEVTRDVPAGLATGTVIVDRLTGLLMLFVMALAALPFRPESFPADVLQLVVAVSVAGLLGGALLLEGSIVRRFGRWLPPQLSPVGDGPVARVLQAVTTVGWRYLGGALAVSLGFNLILAVWWWSAGRALAFIGVPFSYYLLVIPILSISLLVPSIGGLGPREYVAQILFAGAGLLPGEAVALSLLVFLLQRLSGLIGGPLYLWMTLRSRPPDVGADDSEPESD